MSKKSYRRKQYLIKPDLQTKYALMFVLSIGVGINLGVILTLLIPLLKTQSPFLISLYAGISLSFIVLVAGISILFTHKIAGPIYKVERVFRQIADQKDLSVRLQLRTGDEMQELSDEVNHLLNTLHSDLMLQSQKTEAILVQIDDAIAEAEKTNSNPESLVELKNVRRSVAENTLNYRLK